MRLLGTALALALAGHVYAAQTDYTRGEFSFSVGPEPAFVEVHDVPAQWDASAPGASEARWRFWLNEAQVDRRPGQDTRYIDYVYEARDATLLGEAGKFQIEFNPAYQKLVIHHVDIRRDGAWQSRLAPERISLARRESGFEEDMADGEVTALIVLDDVRVNDLVRIRYSITGSNPVLAGQTLDGLSLGWTSPVLDARLRVLHAPGRTLAWHVENGVQAPRVSTDADATTAEVVTHGLGPVVNEDNYPVGFEPYPSAVVSVRRSWKDVVDWALPLYPPVETLPADLEARLKDWMRMPDPLARATLALRAVQDEVRYFGAELGDNSHRPNAPALVWSRRYGDCKDKAYLLVTLLHRLGIDAEPALVSMGQGETLAQLPPSASDFDHVIARARINGETLWLDGTLTGEGGSARDGDSSLLGYALPIRAGVDRLERVGTVAGRNDGVASSERYTPASTGTSTDLVVRTVYRGRAANHVRRTLLTERRDDVARRYRDFYSKRYGELKELDALKLEDDRAANMVTVVEHYQLAAPFERAGNERWLDVTADALGDPTTLPGTLERTGPLYFGQPAHYTQDVEIALPAQWRSLESAETQRIDSAAFGYRRDIETDAQRVKVKYTLDVKQRELAAGTTAAHLADLRRVRDSLSARLNFSAAASQNAAEREARLKALLRAQGAQP